MTLSAGVLGPPAEDTLPPLRHRSKARREHVTTAMLLAPPAIYFVLLLVVPLVVLLVYSFYTYQDFNFTSKLTLTNYSQALTSPALRDFYFRTLKIAFAVSIIVVAVSYTLLAHPDVRAAAGETDAVHPGPGQPVRRLPGEDLRLALDARPGRGRELVLDQHPHHQRTTVVPAEQQLRHCDRVAELPDSAGSSADSSAMQNISPRPRNRPPACPD